MSEEDAQRFVTPEFRANYCYLDEKKQPPAASEGGSQNPYWCLTLALPKDHPFWDELDERIQIALEAKFGSKLPKKWRSPVRDGDEGENEDFHGCNMIELKSPKRKPGVKVYNPDGANTDVVDYDEEIYSGMECIATARVGAYDNVSKGVGIYLNNVLKVADGERFAGSVTSAEEDFEGFKPSKASKGHKTSKAAKKSSPLD